MAGDKDYVLKGFAVPEQLAAVHDLLRQAAADHPELDSTDIMLFETAVIEIANNVVEYGRPAGEIEWELRLRVTDDAIEGELFDTGQEFKPSLSGGGMPDPMSEHGRGMPIAEAVLDKIDFERIEDTNHWKMTRKLGGGTPTAAAFGDFNLSDIPDAG
jgi:serine/threonine-protein kinase RsbW